MIFRGFCPGNQPASESPAIGMAEVHVQHPQAAPFEVFQSKAMHPGGQADRPEINSRLMDRPVFEEQPVVDPDPDAVIGFDVQDVFAGFYLKFGTGPDGKPIFGQSVTR